MEANGKTETGATALTAAGEQGDPDKGKTEVLAAEGDKSKVVDAGKTEGDKAGEKAKADAAKADLDLKLPEGWDSKDPLLGSFKATAKELGLDSPKAQKLFDLYAGAQKAANEKAAADLDAQFKGWKDAAKGDKEFGGKEFDGSLKAARKALASYGTPELAKFLDETGLGDHPELIRAFVRVGKAMAEDSVAGTKAAPANGAGDEAAFLKALYPNTKFPQS